MSKFNNLKKIFSIKSISDSKDQVSITVHVDDIEVITEFPFIKKQYRYINLKKVDNRHIVILTIIKEDGNTFSFNWGSSDSLISENLIELKRAVLQFVEDETGITHFNSGY